MKALFILEVERWEGGIHENLLLGEQERRRERGWSMEWELVCVGGERGGEGLPESSEGCWKDQPLPLILEMSFPPAINKSCAFQKPFEEWLRG